MKKKVLPNLLVVGAQKAGTTSLFDILNKHPDFYLPKKEIKFFHRDEHYQKGINWYSKHFKNHAGEKYIGDFTPDYMAYSWTAERISKHLDEPKIIFILRQPAKRAYSQFNFYRMNGVENETNFEKVIAKEFIDLNQNTFVNWYTPANYISRSIYSPQIERFSKYFKCENIHIIIFEELFIHKKKEAIVELENFLDVGLESYLVKSEKSNITQLPKNVTIKSIYSKTKRILRPVKKIFLFIGITNLFKSINERMEKTLSKKPQKLDQNLITTMNKKYFSNDIKELEKIMGREIKVWK